MQQNVRGEKTPQKQKLTKNMGNSWQTTDDLTKQSKAELPAHRGLIGEVETAETKHDSLSA